MTCRSWCSVAAVTLGLILVIAPGDRASAQGGAPAPPIPPDSAAVAAAREHALPHAGLLRPDRLQHLSLSFALGLGVGIATDQPVAAFAVPGGLGALKEVDDRRAGRSFDRIDLLADLLGAGLAALATAALGR